MIKSKSKIKNNLLKLCVAFLFPFTLFGGLSLTQMSNAVNAADYVESYQENVTITNSSFTQGSFASASNSLSGWSAIESSSKATGMFVDVGTGITTDETGSNATFSKYRETYMLSKNPGARGNSDTRILMINSKTYSQDQNVAAQKGYRSESITLEANSYYSFTVAVKTDTNGDDSANASIYISGLVDKDGKTLDPIGYENILTKDWKDYHFFIATGDQSQTVTIDLYLGSANGGRSSGAVFFDEIRSVRYSENAFYQNCYHFGYNGEDTYLDYNAQTCFLTNALLPSRALVDLSGYNLDFEEPIEADTNTLGDDWSIVSRNSNGHAVISKIKMQPSDFASLTGYSYTGDDLSYDNEQSLILYTTSSNGYVGVQSRDIEIKAHNIYKVTLKMKASQIDSGSFYLKIQENDNIYTLYPNILSDDEDADNYYATQSGQTSGITSNVDSPFTNDYQTVEMYVKGHSLYDSSINLELWFGDATTAAQGCVVIDNIEVEYADYDDFSSASNSLELLSFSSSPSGISNSYFNQTNFTHENKYPLIASDWTSEIEDEKLNESGVIYLYDSDSYKTMYSGKYDWAGVYPGNPNNTLDYDLPNNVYMMQNKNNSYQSLTSSSTTLSSNSYYNISFDYYNQNGVAGLNNSEIVVELVDSNGIVIFSQSGIASLNRWNKMEIYVKTAETVSSDVNIKIYFGEEENKVGGIVYLDNFQVQSSTEEAFTAARYTCDLSDYYFSITDKGPVTNVVTSAPAYKLTIDQIYDDTKTEADSSDCAIAGLVSGSDNPYITFDPSLKIDDSNLLVIQTMYASSASLTTAYSLTLEADNYYMLTFDLATIFNLSAQNSKTDEHDCKYGLTITVEGFEEVAQIVTSTELQNYKLYLHCTETTNPTIKFTLVSDCNDTLGTAIITHLDFTTITQNDYNNAKLSPLFEEKVFTPAQTSSTETDDDTSDDDTAEDTQEPEGNNVNPLLLISSIIMALALIFAIVAFALRKVKIKKIDKIKKETYDRKLSINHDAVLNEAQKQRDIEFEGLKKAKQQLLDEKEEIERQHKEFIKEARLENKEKISKNMEKTFKQYNAKINRIDEKINIINEKIDNCMSAEYLLSIQRSIIAKQEEEFTFEKRAYKEALKQKKKEEKKASDKTNQKKD